MLGDDGTVEEIASSPAGTADVEAADRRLHGA